MLTRQERKDALELVRWDDIGPHGDHFGVCMDHWFAVAAVLYHRTDYATPYQWEYRPGMGEDDIDEEESTALDYATMLDNGQITPDQLIYAGNVMCRWSSLLKHAGKDY